MSKKTIAPIAHLSATLLGEALRTQRAKFTTYDGLDIQELFADEFTNVEDPNTYEVRVMTPGELYKARRWLDREALHALHEAQVLEQLQTNLEAREAARLERIEQERLENERQDALWIRVQRRNRVHQDICKLHRANCAINAVASASGLR